MHHALLINEVVEHIAEGVGTEDDQTLLEMSLVCRAFFDPAMNVRWRVLSDIDHLIRVLPVEILDGIEVDEEAHAVFTRPPSELEWQRFAQYARRVRALDCWQLSFSIMSSYVDIIIDHFPYGQLFPNLHTLRSNSLLPSSRLLQSPLRHLKLKKIHSHRMEDIMDALPACASTLETIFMDTMTCGAYCQSEDLSQKFSEALGKMEKLTQVFVALPFPSAIQHLSTLSTLRELSLHKFTALDTATLRFPALTYLMFWLEAVNIPALAPFLKNLEAPILQELSVYPQVDFDSLRNTANHNRPLAMNLQAILREISHLTTLRIFTFDAHCGEDTSPLYNTHILDGHMLAPLFSLRDLETLRLSTWPARLSLADTEAMARAWPRIERLCISDGASATLPAALDLLPVDAVLPFACLCPALVSLRLPLQITHAPLHAPSPPTLAAKRVDLGVVAVQPDVAGDVVRLLARLCRCVRVMGTGDEQAQKALKLRMDEVRDAEQAAARGGEGAGPGGI
ncbi:hypothetical protein PsYK624_118900 [Phanerochaete sordida]|uniref:F-box domain-containing protein n=1 Tax=Phanerochaete sordida TaxID=48140 RepID=A0A9P3GLL3_9APHY|nr:hypothetical protein PsYK624_118900 [Phanerochaete sordida]